MGVIFNAPTFERVSGTQSESEVGRFRVKVKASQLRIVHFVSYTILLFATNKFFSLVRFRKMCLGRMVNELLDISRYSRYILEGVFL